MRPIGHCVGYTGAELSNAALTLWNAIKINNTQLFAQQNQHRYSGTENMRKPLVGFTFTPRVCVQNRNI